VVVASCFGLSGRALADAFLGKGAAYFISWDWKVSTQVMDEGLRMLVEEAVVKGRGWSEAVEAVAERLGPDPLGEASSRSSGAGGRAWELRAGRGG